MGLDQTIKTTNKHIQDAMGEKGTALVPYANIAQQRQTYEEFLANADEGQRGLISKLLASTQEVVGEWRYANFLHCYFEQECQKRFGHSLDENGTFLEIGAPDLSNLLNVIFCVLEGFKKDEETGTALAKSLLPNVDICYGDCHDLNSLSDLGDNEDYDEDYRTQLVETAEWLKSLLSTPGVQIATFRYEYSY